MLRRRLQEQLEDRLLDASPGLRILAGVVLTLLSSGLVFLPLRLGLLWYGGLFGIAFGPALIFNGIGEARRQAVVAAEQRRAQAEWGELRRDVHLWRRTGQNLARRLQERGYREFVVRRWIVASLEDEGDVA